MCLYVISRPTRSENLKKLSHFFTYWMPFNYFFMNLINFFLFSGRLCSKEAFVQNFFKIKSKIKILSNFLWFFKHQSIKHPWSHYFYPVWCHFLIFWWIWIIFFCFVDLLPRNILNLGLGRFGAFKWP